MEAEPVRILNFQYELLPNLEAVRQQVRECEGKHVQQVIFSTFMDALTQVCFTCMKVRSTIMWDGNRSWNMDHPGIL
jgi:hypothetical protein